MTGMMNNFNQASSPNQQPPTMGGEVVPPPIPTSIQYLIGINGQHYGPYNIQQMQQMARNGQININTLVWTQGMPQWATASSIPELSCIFIPPMPPTL